MSVPQNNFKRTPKKDDGGYKINEKIYSKKVRLVRDGQEPLICDTSEALEIARESGLDLVEVSPNAEPPVCRIIDYQKFLYDKRKKEKENKRSKSTSAMKEIKMTPNIGDHDYLFKAKQASGFLEKGNKVKITVFFKGRTILYREQGEMLMLKFSQEVTDFGRVEQLPKMEGKYMSMILVPKKK